MCRRNNSITRIYAKSWESSLSEGYDSKSCIQINHNKNLVLGPLKIAAATPLISHRKCTGRIFAYVLSWEKRQMVAPTYKGSRVKFYSRTISKHDFGPNPSDRELFYDIEKIVVRLMSSDCFHQLVLLSHFIFIFFYFLYFSASSLSPHHLFIHFHLFTHFHLSLPFTFPHFPASR